MKKRILAAAIVLMMLFTAAALAGCKVVTVASNPKDLFIETAHLDGLFELPEPEQWVKELNTAAGTLTLNKLSVMGKDFLDGKPATISMDGAKLDGGIGIASAVLDYDGDKLEAYSEFDLDEKKVFWKISGLMDKYYVNDLSDGKEQADKADTADIAESLKNFAKLITGEANKSLKSIDEAKFAKETATVEANGIKAEDVTAVTLTLSPEDVEKLVRDYANTITGAKEFSELFKIIESLETVYPAGMQGGTIIPLAAESEPESLEENFKKELTEALDKLFKESKISAVIKLYLLDGKRAGGALDVNIDGIKDSQPTGEKMVLNANAVSTDAGFGAEMAVKVTGTDSDGEETTPAKLTYRKDKDGIKGDFVFYKGLKDAEPALAASVDMTSTDGEYYKGFAKFDYKPGREEDNLSAKLEFGFSCTENKIKIDTESLMISQGLPFTVPLKINAEITKGDNKMELNAKIAADMGAMANVEAQLALTAEKGTRTADANKQVYTDEEMHDIDFASKLKEKCPKIYGIINSVTGGGSGNFGGGDGDVIGDESYISNDGKLDLVHYSDGSSLFVFTVQGKMEFGDGFVTVSALDFSEKLAFEGDPKSKADGTVEIGGKTYFSMFFDADDDPSDYEIIYYRNTEEGAQVAFERYITTEYGENEFDTFDLRFYSPSENNEWVLEDFGKGLGIKTTPEEGEDGEGKTVTVEFTYPAAGGQSCEMTVYEQVTGEARHYYSEETGTEIYLSDDYYAEIYFYGEITFEDGIMYITHSPELEFAYVYTDLGGGTVRIGNDTFNADHIDDFYGESVTLYSILSETETQYNDIMILLYDDNSAMIKVCCDVFESDQNGVVELCYGSAGSVKMFVESDDGYETVKFTFVFGEGGQDDFSYSETLSNAPVGFEEDD